METQDSQERNRRWRLVLGEAAAEPAGGGLSAGDQAIDRALAQLYDESSLGGGRGRSAGSGASSPAVARWLGDIRTYFPASVVQVMQRDAIERLNLRELLLEPEILEVSQPDVHLAATLIALKSVIPDRTRDTARQVVRAVVDALMKRLAEPMRQAVAGSLDRSRRNRRPRQNEIDWDRTVRANLKHYQPQYRTIVPETLIGWARRRSSLRDIVLCVDQSGSMASSVVYASIFGAVLATLPSVQTRMTLFDTSVVDLTEYLTDPVELLFGAQLGGGTDINGAIAYCESRIARPADTIMVLISDLYEGGDADQMLARAAKLVAGGVRLIALLALSDEGAPSYNAFIAERLASLGVPAFACTPDLFPELMAAALRGSDIGQWAAQKGIVAARAVT